VSTEICCDQMQNQVINNRGYYENEDIIIVTGKNDTDDIYYMCLDKKNKDTMPLGACIWCGADLP